MRLRNLPKALFVFSLGLLLVIPATVHPSIGQTGTTTAGTVCTASPLSTSLCPTNSTTLPGPTGGSTTVDVNIVGSGPYNSFDIMVKADPLFLNATSFDLTNSVLSNPVIGTACVNGKSLGGHACSPQDGLGVAHLSASAGCAGVTDGCTAGDGQLFGIIYKVVVPGKSIPVVFQTGCSGGSNSTSCVTIEWITAIILCCPIEPENLETATFSTGIVPGMFSQTETFLGVTATASGSFLVNQTSRTLIGTVSVTATNSTTGALIYAKSFNVTLIFYPGTGVLRFILKIPVSSGALASTCQVSFLFGNVLCFMSKTPDLNGNGVVDIIDVSIVFIAFGSSAGSVTYNPAADLDGDGTISITDAGIIVADFGTRIIA